MEQLKQAQIDSIVSYGLTSYEAIGTHLFIIGYCSNCGACCKNIDVFVCPPENIVCRPVTHRLKSLTKDPDGVAYVRHINKGDAEYGKYCHHLVKQEDGTFLCGVYDVLPEFCSKFPRTSTPPTTCTYLLVDKVELRYFLHKVDERSRQSGPKNQIFRKTKYRAKKL